VLDDAHALAPATRRSLEQNRIPHVHRDAARFLSEHYADARVLTTWPASDELKNPYFGYTPRALQVVSIKNFLPDALEQAAQQKSDYDVALVFTTHGGPSLEDATRTLGGRVVFNAEKNGQWAAVLDMKAKE
jgi:ABC-type taurine transport system substrate-binding protein